MKRKMIVLCLLLLLLAVQGAQAMALAAYNVDWHNFATGSGDAAASAGYRVNLTIGQVAIERSSSPDTQAIMGYWAGVGVSRTFRVFLPGILRLP